MRVLVLLVSLIFLSGAIKRPDQRRSMRRDLSLTKELEHRQQMEEEEDYQEKLKKRKKVLKMEERDPKDLPRQM